LYIQAIGILSKKGIQIRANGIER